MEGMRGFETSFERQRRLEHNKICREYLRYSEDILSGRLSPHRVISRIAGRYDRSTMGVKVILRKAGIYQDAKHPVLKSVLDSCGKDRKDDSSMKGGDHV